MHAPHCWRQRPLQGGLSVWLNGPPELLARRVVGDGTETRPLLSQVLIARARMLRGWWRWFDQLAAGMQKRAVVGLQSG